MEKKDIIDFFDRCAPDWDAEMIRNEKIITTILDNAGIDCGMDVLGFTLCSNMAAGVLDQPLDGEEVIAAGIEAAPRFSALVKACLERV